MADLGNPEQNIAFILGRMDGKLDALHTGQDTIMRRIDSLDSRVMALEGESLGRLQGEKTDRKWTAGLAAVVTLVVTGVLQLLSAALPSYLSK